MLVDKFLNVNMVQYDVESAVAALLLFPSVLMTIITVL